jgi:hypothetical protein
MAAPGEHPPDLAGWPANDRGAQTAAETVLVMVPLPRTVSPS